MSVDQYQIFVFYCSGWAVFHWRCWRWFWCGLIWICIQVTLRVMTMASHTSQDGPAVLSGEHSVCCPQSAATGTRLWLAGRSHQLRTGSDISSRSKL